MKKFWLSFFVIGTFTLYAAYFGNNGSLSYVAAPVIDVKNKTVNNNQNTTSVQTTTNVPIASVRRNNSDDDNTSEDDYYGFQVTPTPSVPQITTTTTKTVPKSIPTPAPAPQPIAKPKGLYTDGTYTGSNEYAYSDYIQVQAVISGGRLSNILFPSSASGPNRSRQIYSYSMPQLKSEAISAQSANINGVSGATYTSAAFMQSLAYALTQAKQ